MDRIEHCHVKNYSLPAELQVPIAATDRHVKMLDNFIRAILEDGETNAKEALHSVDIIERMYAAITETC